jgi:ATP-dependent DNA helicase RecQ
MQFTQTEPDKLLERFGLESFRPGQRQVIDAVQEGRDVLCVMPTGGGKSLCYQLPTLARPGITLVISPLIALMKDQVDGLQRLGIAARLINSTLSLAQQDEVMESMVRGEVELVYVAPERLRNGRFLETIAKSNVSLLAVDEAHCVSEWGHDFRPDYARLGSVRQRYLNHLQTIALTATATPTVRDDVSSLLCLNDPAVFVTGFSRTNLHFGVTQCKTDSEKEKSLAAYVRRQNGAGIVYAATRKACESVGEQLGKSTNQQVGVYHGGMDPESRRAVQEQFMSGELDAIVATNAFGMGIDKADIRYVAHYNMPGTLEAYYQEAGRAGRDGDASDCRLFFSYQDRYIQEFFIENRYPSRDTVKKVYEYLLSREEDPIELTLEQVRKAIDADSAEAVGTSETLLAKAKVLRRLDSSQNQMVVRIDSNATTLLDYLPREAKLRRKVLSAIEKIVGDRREDDVFVRPSRLMQLADVSREQLARTLRELSRLKTFDYVPPFRGRAVHIVQRDLPFEKLEIDFDELARRKAAEYEKLEAVIGFARTGGCRQRVILDYFGDPDSQDCENCDRCAAASKNASEPHPLTKQLSETEFRAFLCGIRVILSGVTRMHGRFGKNLVAQMLCGSQNKRMSQWKLQRLSTYGMLSEMKQSQLTKIIEAMIEHGMVEQREVDQRRPTIDMTRFGKAVMHLRDELPASFTLPMTLAKSLARASRHIESTDVGSAASAPVATAAQEPSSEAASTEASSPETDSRSEDAVGGPGDAATGWSLTDQQTGDAIRVSLEDLTSPEEKLTTAVRDALKRWRRRTSAALGLPAYRILSNSTVDRLADLRPDSSTALESVSGIGPSTMENHGYDILELIRSAVSEHESQHDQAPPRHDQAPDADADSLPSADAASGPPGNIPAEHSGMVEAGLTDEAGGTQRGDSAAPAAAPAETTENRASPAVAPQPAESDRQERVYWTWRLFADGFRLDEVRQIRRLSTAEILSDLKQAAAEGRKVDERWLTDR